MKTELTKVDGFIHELDEATEQILVNAMYSMLCELSQWKNYAVYLPSLEANIEGSLPENVNKRHICKCVMKGILNKIKSEKNTDIKFVNCDYTYDKYPFHWHIEIREGSDIESDDINDDDNKFTVSVFENGNLTKETVCDYFYNALWEFYREIVEFERAHDYITSSYYPE